MRVYRPDVPFDAVVLTRYEADEIRKLIQEMSKYVGGMALQNYQRFNEAPMYLDEAIKEAEDEKRRVHYVAEMCREKWRNEMPDNVHEADLDNLSDDEAIEKFMRHH